MSQQSEESAGSSTPSDFHSDHSEGRVDEYSEETEETLLSSTPNSARDIWADMVNAATVLLPHRINFPATALDKTSGTAENEDVPSDLDVYTFYRVQPILKSELTSFFGWDTSTNGFGSSQYTRTNMRPFFQHMLGSGLLRQTIHPILPVVNTDETPTTILNLKLEVAAALQCGACPVHAINKEGMPPVVDEKGLAKRFGGALSDVDTTTVATSASASAQGDVAVDSSSTMPSYLGDVFSLRYDAELALAEIIRPTLKNAVPASAQQQGGAPLPRIPRPPSSTGTDRPAVRRPLGTVKKDGEFVDGNVPAPAPQEEDANQLDEPPTACTAQNQLYMAIHSNADHLASLPRNSRLYVLINDC